MRCQRDQGWTIYPEREVIPSQQPARLAPGEVVPFETGEPNYLRMNIAALLKTALPLADRQILTKLFGHLTGVRLDPLNRMKIALAPNMSDGNRMVRREGSSLLIRILLGITAATLILIVPAKSIAQQRCTYTGFF